MNKTLSQPFYLRVCPIRSQDYRVILKKWIFLAACLLTFVLRMKDLIFTGVIPASSLISAFTCRFAIWLLICAFAQHLRVSHS